MSLPYGAKFLNETAADERPHVLGFQTPRSSDDSLFEVWNDDAGSDQKFIVYPNMVEVHTDLRPDGDASRDLGADGKEWKKVWAQDGAFSGSLTVGGSSLVTSATFTAHTGNTSNPHSVTKTQVSLGSVENFGIASQGEAEAGSASDKYMTPERVAQAIGKLTPYDLAYWLGTPEDDEEIAMTVARDSTVTAVAGRVGTAPSGSITFQAQIDGGTAFDLFTVSAAGAVATPGTDPYPFDLDAGETLTIIAPADMDGAADISIALTGTVR